MIPHRSHQLPERDVAGGLVTLRQRAHAGIRGEPDHPARALEAEIEVERDLGDQRSDGDRSMDAEEPRQLRNPDAGRQEHGAEAAREFLHRPPYCSATRIGISPRPSRHDRSALPITAPKAFAGSQAFIACPGVADVVSRSPTSIGAYAASTRQNTLPTRASGRRPGLGRLRPRMMPGLRSPAPDSTPATFLS